MKLILVLCLIVSSTMAQVRTLNRPLLMGLHGQMHALYNPATAGQFNRFEGWTALQRWPLLTYITAHFNGRLSKAKTFESVSVLGLTLTDERNGSFINRTTAHLLFCRHQRLNENLFLSAAINMGWASYVVGQTQNRAGFSDNVWDGALGLSLWGDGFSIGISMLYAFDSQLQPAGSVETLKLARHYNLIAQKNLFVNPDFSLEPSVLIRYGLEWANFGLKPDLAVSIFAHLQQRVKVGFNYLHGSGITFGVGLHEVSFEGLPPFSLTVGYTQPFDQTQLRSINRYELVLRIERKVMGKVGRSLN